MLYLLQFLGANPYILLFVVLGLSMWIGHITVKGYSLGAVAAAIVVGCGISVLGSAYGVTFSLDDFTKSLFYYLFMYGVGLRVGPSFINSLKGDGLKFTVLAVVCSFLGLFLVVIGNRLFELPLGAAGGMLAGSMTMSAALGSAEQAITQGAVSLPLGTTAEQVSAMIALSFGITYIWGTVGIILLCKYLPHWWGIDARKAAREYEVEHAVPNVDDANLTAYHPYDMRAYHLHNKAWAGKTIGDFTGAYEQYHVFNVVRDNVSLGAEPDIVLALNDVVVLSATLEDLTDHIGLIGPEEPNLKSLNIPVDQAEILVTKHDVLHKSIHELDATLLAGPIQITRIERAGHAMPLGPGLTLQRMDVLFVTGVKSVVDKVANTVGVVARHNSSTDLLTLSIGMILGFLIGQIQFPAAGANISLGNAGGLLVSGIIVSSAYSRLRFFGNTPNAARNVLEDLGLNVFVAIVGVNAGATLLSQITGLIALKIFVVGFAACTLPPLVVWAIGYHIMKINPAVLMGAVAGARSHSGPAREAAKEANSSVPWLGFPVGYAVSGILLTVFGYVAMVLG
ncbi:MAG: transporter [Candidatus Adiutrix sp.]|jgi:putative transport protein|nr:transporter [Candidatus Adiutrix sp.]